jgi:hypothetical protein
VERKSKWCHHHHHQVWRPPAAARAGAAAAAAAAEAAAAAQQHNGKTTYICASLQRDTGFQNCHKKMSEKHVENVFF